MHCERRVSAPYAAGVRRSRDPPDGDRDVVSDRLRERARCTGCGDEGRNYPDPSWCGNGRIPAISKVKNNGPAFSCRAVQNQRTVGAQTLNRPTTNSGQILANRQSDPIRQITQTSSVI